MRAYLGILAFFVTIIMAAYYVFWEHSYMAAGTSLAFGLSITFILLWGISEWFDSTARNIIGSITTIFAFIGVLFLSDGFSAQTHHDYQRRLMILVDDIAYNRYENPEERELAMLGIKHCSLASPTDMINATKQAVIGAYAPPEAGPFVEFLDEDDRTKDHGGRCIEITRKLYPKEFGSM